jgi:predicted nucleic acid-binding protein
MAMRRYCLDTSAYSHFKRGVPGVVDIISRAHWLGAPAIVLGELRTGFLAGSRSEQNEQELQRFLSHPNVEVLVVDSETSQIYAEIMLELRTAGTPLPSNDVWIAAAAVREGATILTYDAHFESIRRVGSKIMIKKVHRTNEWMG